MSIHNFLLLLFLCTVIWFCYVNAMKHGGTNIYFLLSCSTMLGRSVRDLARPQNTAKGCNSWTRDLNSKETPVFTDGLPDWTGFTTHHATNSTPLVTYICTLNHHQKLFMPTARVLH